MRGAVGVTVALPVSIRSLGLGYWLIGVCMPAILMGLAQILATIVAHQFHPAITLGWGSLALNFLLSLFLAGSIFFLFTFLTVVPQEGLWNKITEGLAGAFWGTTIFSGGLLRYSLVPEKAGFGIGLTVLLSGLTLTALGCSRAEKLVVRRSRNRSTQAGSVPKPAPVRKALDFGGTGLSYLFVARIRGALGMALPMTFFLMILGLFKGNSHLFEFLLLICSLIPNSGFDRSMRQMRTLPFSTNKLSLILFMLPLANLATITLTLVLVHLIGVQRVFDGNSASLLLMAGTISICNSLSLRLGQKALPLILPLGIFLVGAYSELMKSLSPIFFWILGLLLIGASFGLLRVWLQSSATYRPSGKSFAGI